jgi:hypothetical protein
MDQQYSDSDVNRSVRWQNFQLQKELMRVKKETEAEMQLMSCRQQEVRMRALDWATGRT